MATLVLQEDFDSITEWTLVGNPITSVGLLTGRSQRNDSGSTARFPIPAISESDTVTAGVAVYWDLSAARAIVQFVSDAGATTHVTLMLTTGGAVEVRRGTSSGTVLGTSATGLVPASSRAYVEVQAKLHDTTGFVIVRVNGTQVLTLTNVDTKNAGTKTTFDGLFFPVNTVNVDDLYLVTGADGAFLGEQRYGFDASVLHEPFNNLTNWTTVSGVASPAIVAGRTGTAVDLGTASQEIKTSIPSGQTSYQAIVGFAFKPSSLVGGGILGGFRAGGTLICDFRVYADGHLDISGAVAATAAGLVVTGVWTYIEIKAVVAELAVATLEIRVNGILAGSASGVNFGGLRIFDAVHLKGITSGPAVTLYDDLYIRTGTLSNFEGDPLTVNTVLTEDFDATPEWTLVSGSPGAQVGVLTGRSMQMGSAASLRFPFPAAVESDTLTVGIAVSWDLTASRSIIRLDSDAGATAHLSILLTTTGAIEVRRGTASGFILGTTAAGLVAASTRAYVEVQAKLHDLAGTVTVRVNGTQRLALSNVDTKNAGTKATFDSVFLPTSTTVVDDLYVLSGPAASFLGEQRYGFDASVLHEPFNDLTSWTIPSSFEGRPVITTGGRTGKALNCGNVGATVRLAIPSGQRSYEFFLGFAIRPGSLATVTNLITLRVAGVDTSFFRARTDGSLDYSSSFAITPAGVLAVGVWTYLEFHLVIAGTTSQGIAEIRANGVVVGSSFQVSFGRALTIFDEITLCGLSNVSGAQTLYDDLYLRTGTLAAYEGPQAIGPATSAAAKIWNGAAFVDAPVKSWDGSAFVDDAAVKTWNGAAFV